VHYLPLPRSVVPIVAIVTVLVVLLLGWGSMRKPEAFWAPGDLSRYHRDVTQCLNCHAPFRGPVTEKCIVCHSEASFKGEPAHSMHSFHRDVLREQQSCLACHTEHRGAAPITSSAVLNPHGGNFIFVITGTSSCAACHQFRSTFGAGPTLVNNEIVGRLMSKGGGAHRPGQMAHCLNCHARSS